MNLLIVDDEPLIHVSIEFSLKELGDEDIQIYHASNGNEMLLKMEACEMDIALVDIRMPGMDGLTAISTARQRWPRTHYYIMSGFSEFEYAREAIRLNVIEYLLKPLSPEQLAEIISRVRQEKDREENQLRESFNAWMVGTLHLHDVSSLFDSSYSAALVLFCYDSEKEKILNWVPEALHDKAANELSLPCWEGMLHLLYAKEVSYLREILHRISKQIFPEGVTGFISNISSDSSVLAKEMHRMLDLCPLRIFQGIGQCYKLNQISNHSRHDLYLANEWIELKNIYFEKHFANFISKSSSLVSSLSELTSVQISHLSRYLSSVTGEKPADPVDARSISAFLTDIGSSLIQHESAPDRIDTVIAYVQENYCEDISIAQLSLRFDLSPNYLSTLFKKKLGVNFVDYLTSLRLSKAKELLLSGTLSVREIGESVGYYSQSYFNKMFIKKEGCTPGEYRKKAGNS